MNANHSEAFRLSFTMSPGIPAELEYRLTEDRARMTIVGTKFPPNSGARTFLEYVCSVEEARESWKNAVCELGAVAF